MKVKCIIPFKKVDCKILKFKNKKINKDAHHTYRVLLMS